MELVSNKFGELMMRIRLQSLPIEAGSLGRPEKFLLGSQVTNNLISKIHSSSCWSVHTGEKNRPMVSTPAVSLFRAGPWSSRLPSCSDPPFEFSHRNPDRWQLGLTLHYTATGKCCRFLDSVVFFFFFFFFQIRCPNHIVSCSASFALMRQCEKRKDNLK